MRIVLTVDSRGRVEAMHGDVSMITGISGKGENMHFYVSDNGSRTIGYVPDGTPSCTFMDIPDLPVPEHLKEAWEHDR